MLNFLILGILNILFSCSAKLEIKNATTIEATEGEAVEKKPWDDAKGSVSEAVRALNHEIIPQLTVKMPLDIQSYYPSRSPEEVKKTNKNSYETETLKVLNDKFSRTNS